MMKNPRLIVTSNKEKTQMVGEREKSKQVIVLES